MRGKQVEKQGENRPRAREHSSRFFLPRALLSEPLGQATVSKELKILFERFMNISVKMRHVRMLSIIFRNT